MAERSGILEFTLGLTTGGFLSHLEGATGAVKGFIGSMIGLGAIIEGVKSAIDQGADLAHLAKRTGEAAGTLYELQRGFARAGLEAADVAPALSVMQRSLGGVNELGERTEDIFLRMGLRIHDLKQMSGLQAFQTIIGAMAKLDQNSAMKGGAGIFGRNEGASMVQLSRSTKEFAEGLKDAEGSAKLFERDAEAFNQFKITLEEMREQLKHAFAEMAELVVAFTNAWKQGRVSELIATSITTGFRAALDVIPAILKGFATSMVDSLALAGIDFGIASVKKSIAAGERGDPARLAMDQEQLERLQGQRANMLAASRIDDATLKSSLQAALEKAKMDLAPLTDLVTNLNSGLKAGSAGEKAAPGAPLDNAQEHRTEFTPLEKMGFVMGGLGMPAMNDIRQNTKLTADRLAILVGLQKADRPTGHGPMYWLP